MAVGEASEKFAEVVTCQRGIRLCGKISSAEGVRNDSRRLDGLLNTAPPTTGAHLQQFLQVMQWMRTAIPQAAQRTEPLHLFLERVYRHVGKPARRAAQRCQIRVLGWGPKDSQAFEACKEAIAQRVTLQYRDPAQRLCVYTDATHEFWSGVVTQVPHEDLSKPHH